MSVEIVDTLHCIILDQGSIITVQPIYDMVGAEYTKTSTTRGKE